MEVGSLIPSAKTLNERDNEGPLAEAYLQRADQEIDQPWLQLIKISPGAPLTRRQQLLDTETI